MEIPPKAPPQPQPQWGWPLVWRRQGSLVTPAPSSPPSPLHPHPTFSNAWGLAAPSPCFAVTDPDIQRPVGIELPMCWIFPRRAAGFSVQLPKLTEALFDRGRQRVGGGWQGLRPRELSPSGQFLQGWVQLMHPGCWERAGPWFCRRKTQTCLRVLLGSCRPQHPTWE